MRRATLVVAVILATVSGCAQAGPGGGRESSDDIPLPGQQWALGDGKVTEAEYRTAMDRFVSCVRGAGYPVTDPVRSPADNLTLIYTITPSGDPDTYNSAVQSCNLSHLSLVEPTFVAAQPQVMDEPLRTAVGNCLRQQGAELTAGERNLADFARSAKDEARVVDCVTGQWARVYPRLPAEVPLRF
ncbi:hypothetical protein J7F03_40430 [Streptomyces sp. ISL-43]|uniref:hypothetical protein n=1 Tax=Streptomyces sp. ISL-43 TaxID=2819183 RepID=UPI001BEBC8A2|nr:hypothetical protein [Streptomyces sp. ISL-43]MBT2453174.1 hypothetical protein [Streptomyces sp. ISL-43]